jgi:succinate dehydrogenase/fumarate reductase flavoprotein subunit
MTADGERAAGYDVIVTGYGGAGATAAMAAHDAGARVLVLEKAPAGWERGGVRRLLRHRA